MPQPIIVIDPGHGGTQNVGGSDANHAVGPVHHLKEKDLTLDISIRTAEFLNSIYQWGTNVLLTRNSDTNLSLTNRAKVAKDNNAIAFISIHFNGDQDPNIQGTETWIHTTHANNSNMLASILLQEVLNVTQVRNRGVRMSGLDVLDPARHLITTATCLVEVCYLSNAPEEDRLIDPNYKDSIARAIAKGIYDFVNGSSSIPLVKPVDGILYEAEGL